MPRPSTYRIYAIYEGSDLLYIGCSTRSPKEYYYGIRSATYDRDIKTYLLSKPTTTFTVKMLASFKYRKPQKLALIKYITDLHPKFNSIPLLIVEETITPSEL